MCDKWHGHKDSYILLSQKELNQKLVESENKIDEYYRNKSSYRDDYLQRLAEFYKGTDDEKCSKCVLEIKKRECRSRIFSKMRRVIKGRRFQISPEIEVEKNSRDVEEMWDNIKNKKQMPQEWETIQGTENVSKLLMPWCQKHFLPAEETPLTKDEWDKTLDLLQKDNKVQEILEGLFHCAAIDTIECTQWIEGLKRKNSASSVTAMEFTEDDFKDFIKKRKNQRSRHQVAVITDSIKC